MLSSIDGGASNTQLSPPYSVASRADGSTVPVDSRKRKAEESLAKPERKQFRPDAEVTKRPACAATTMTSRPTAAKTLPQKATGASQALGKATANQTQIEAPKKVPKKGSYAEILARGQQNQTLQVPIITHKPIASHGGKKELSKQKAMLKSGRKQGSKKLKRFGQQHGSERPETGNEGRVVYQGTSRPKPQPSYQGTAKPKPTPTYQGTMKPATKPSSGPKRLAKPQDVERKSQPLRRKNDVTDEDEDSEGSEGRYDYASEDYSDMDAGFDDVEGEEEEAARFAKKEDAREQKMLDEYKRQKEERKRKLAQLAEKQRR